MVVKTDMFSNGLLERLRWRLGPDLLSESKGSGNTHYLTTRPNKVTELAEYITREVGGRLMHISVIDRGLNGYEVVYHYALDHLEKGFHVNIEVLLPEDNPEIESVTRLLPEASWSEREMMELTPVKFIDHPDPRHLWLPYEWPEPVEGGISTSNQGSSVQASLMPIGPYHPLLIEG
ncbi:NADH-quinone oxidoreductase subunit C, partial [Candidatus Bathyarchaeota archaeon]|nr:NADH-quinone oxidoreductase subunit C [Candidatus Bathyarchaeota archaeon]